MKALIFFLLCLPTFAGEEAAVNKVIDGFHTAASKADGDRYFAYLTDDAVFLGTDFTERWTKEAFFELYGPYMASGKGWTFTPTKRFVTVSAEGTVAWFDESLDSQHYGDCRGSGVLVKMDGAWKIAQYNLSIPMPNDLAKEFVARIREYEATKD